MQQADYPLPDPLVTVSPNWLGGEPCFTGRRVPVMALFDFLEADQTRAAFRALVPALIKALQEVKPEEVRKVAA